MRTTLYEKLFIDGFGKPSYVVATAMLEAPLTPQHVRDAALRALERHPRLRSNVRSRFGIPVAFEPRTALSWLDAGGVTHHRAADLAELEERLLRTPMDLTQAHPVEVHLVDEPPAIVVKIHHAVIDASSGFTVLQDFTRALTTTGDSPSTRRSQRQRQRQRLRMNALRRTRTWLAEARIRPRLPKSSVLTSYRPSAPLEREPVAYVERVLHRSYAALTEKARTRGASFSELVASALLSAMASYSQRISSDPPREVGLMFARARPRRRTDNAAAFRSDTSVVSISRTHLATLHHPATLAELRRRVRENGHDEAALGLLYATRKLFGRPNEVDVVQSSLHFTLSDLTSFGRRLDGGFVRDLRVLASPTSFDHAGMMVSRFGDDVRLVVIAHRGALDGQTLLGDTCRLLEES